MSSSLTKEELDAIDDILNDSSDEIDTYIPNHKPILQLPPKEKEKPRILSLPTNNRFQSKTSLGRPHAALSSAAPSSAFGIKKSELPTLKKCTTPCIGGPDLEAGMTEDLTCPKFCTNLICVSCDHKVIRFPNFRWAPSTNYLFLRNNYPDTVKKNLIPAPGVCAYCCQCTFCEETTTKHLTTFNSTWACRGHRC